MYCRGAFDTSLGTHKLPVAVMALSSPTFGYDGDVRTEVAVCKMSGDIKCNIGNAFFRQHPQLTDILAVTAAARSEPQLTEAEHTVNYGQAMNPGQVTDTENKQDPKVNDIAREGLYADTDESIDQGVHTAVTAVRLVKEQLQTDSINSGQQGEATQPLTDDGPQIDTDGITAFTGHTDLVEQTLDSVIDEFHKVDSTHTEHVASIINDNAESDANSGERQFADLNGVVGDRPGRADVPEHLITVTGHHADSDVGGKSLSPTTRKTADGETRREMRSQLD